MPTLWGLLDAQAERVEQVPTQLDMAGRAAVKVVAILMPRLVGQEKVPMMPTLPPEDQVVEEDKVETVVLVRSMALTLPEMESLQAVAGQVRQEQVT